MKGWDTTKRETQKTNIDYKSVENIRRLLRESQKGPQTGAGLGLRLLAHQNRLLARG